MQRWWRTYKEERIEPRLYLLRELRGVAGPLAIWLALLNVLVGVLPSGFMIASSIVVGSTPAAVVGGLGSPAWGSLVAAFVASAGLLFVQQLLAPLSVSLGRILKHQVDGEFHDQILAASLRGAGIAGLEDDKAAGDLWLAAEQLERGRTPGDAAAGTVALVVKYVQLAAYTVLLGVAVSWWAAAVVCLVTMTFRVGHRAVVRIYTRLRPVMGPLRRESMYFRELGIGPSAAKETRVFGLTGWLADRYRASALAALRPVWRERRKANGAAFAWRTVFGVVMAALVLTWMLRAAAAGQFSLTHLVLGVQATLGVLSLGEFYHESDNGTQFGMQSVSALHRFQEAAAALDAPEAQSAETAEPAGLLRGGIRFDNVSFAYPGSERLVLDGLDLTIHAGQCTALVGLNGSGKTTLVKLLSRLYEPTSGAILADGRAIASLDVDAWRRKIAVIFQDFNRYELSVADNIAFGAVEQPADPGRVAAAAHTAGIGKAIAKLPHGIGTLLSRQYVEGAELSGGQWQRIAIARALYAVDHGAQLLVLDEPTSALDVRAEAAFYEEFIADARGRTTLLISHRFSSIRHADRIVVLEHGRVVEDGTHKSLLDQGGRYAGLYHLQARRFQAGEDIDDHATEGIQR
ncbi:ABC transporter ATP-binding protein [Lentzea albidocapillata]|uniref:ATP-binding cassette, subfamily B n=1 Tax=Lentzea albidocapillata TaxID=40571 RepID=A0A1W2F985_9PSEU|nr:ABC transporter ATP-binding protein [Lentzea albidocapillata]SMD18352.1 ATP-binding cassette, subfamily B [Lentzea albidocapillata]